MSQLPFDTPADLAFKGETLVFIGRLWSLGRKDARSTVERLGGTCGEDITPHTTSVVVGADTYPHGVPTAEALAEDHSGHAQKLRRVAQLNAERPDSIRVISSRRSGTNVT